jgi:hypothetical protein
LIVWNQFDGNDTEIFFYDAISGITRQLTDNTVNDDLPTISGLSRDNYIVAWQASDGQDIEIYTYNGLSTQQLTNNRTDDFSPQASQLNLVWTGYGGSDTEIFFYDGATIQQITDNAIEDYYPLISGASIAWIGLESTDSEVFYYSPLTRRVVQLTTNGTDDYISGIADFSLAGGNFVGSPTTGGGFVETGLLPYITWYGFDGQDEDVYLSAGLLRQPLTNNAIDDSVPQVGLLGLRFWVVWYASDGMDTEIYAYDGIATRQLTNNDFDDQFPQISGSTLIWRGVDGLDTDIFYLDLTNL